MAGLRPVEGGPGFRHAGWRPQLGRAALARERRRLLRHCLRLTADFNERQEETMTHVYAGIAGTVGMEHSGGLVGAFRQEIGDNKWQKLGGGLPEEAEVHAITVAPGDGDTVFVGSTKGLYRSGNRGNRFEKL